jgi:eukaryotic-like serine/threonine-protein kinase
VSESFAAGLVGIVLDDRYRLDALLGEGGMGAVYRAHHLAMDRKVAVKLLKPHLTTDETALARFAREARATMKVDSDHAVKVLDFGITPHRDYYMVLEYLDGRTVQQELDVDGPFEPARVVHIAKQALHALGAAHAQGFVHRDIKPDNLFLMRVGDDPDYAKVLDFGVAKLMEGVPPSKSQLAITQAGVVFGTPEFMSPEQACGQPLDGRSDLYSLAATMFAMLTGCCMYKATSAIEWLTHHARTPPPRLVDGLPSLAPYTALDQLLQRCLAKRREDRPADAVAMGRMLDDVASSLRARPKGNVEANETLVPGASLSRLPQQSDVVSSYTPSISSDLLDAPATTTGTVTASRRRTLWLVLGAAIITAMVVMVIIAATRKKPARDRTVNAVEARAALNDAAVMLDAPVDAVPEIRDAAPPNAADAAVQPTQKVRPTAKDNPAVASHIDAAAEAKRAGNRLRQLAEADAALQLDPRNVRARLLFADALIASGDLDRGCKYLRDLGRNPTARERARQAGCPTN